MTKSNKFLPNVKINNKDITQDELDQILKDENQIIQSVSVELGNHRKLPQDKPTMEGFDIPKEFIIEMAENMDAMNAGKITSTFSNSGKLGNKTVKITLISPDYKEPEPNFIERILIKFGLCQFGSK